MMFLSCIRIAAYMYWHETQRKESLEDIKDIQNFTFKRLKIKNF